MTYLLVPLAFLTGGVAGGLLVRTWRGRGDGPGIPTRRQKLKLVAATAFATLLLVAVSGYAFVRLRMATSKMSKASTKEAMADYRKAAGTGAAKHRAGTPPGGVYTYQTKGFLKVESALLGNAHNKLPDTIPAVLIPKGNCWELQLRLYKEYDRTERYCRQDGGGHKLEERWENNEMFGVKSFTRQRCGPHGLLGPTGAPKPGDTWKETWKVAEHKTGLPIAVSRPDLHLEVTYVGPTELEIGGQKVKAHHLKQSAKYGGAVKGSLDREVWYAADTGMMLKLHVLSLGSGMATMKIDRHYLLASLTPKQ